MLEYQDTITVTRLSGSSDGMGGQTGGSYSSVYSGSTDVQDVGKIYGLREGALIAEGDAHCFLSESLSGTGIDRADKVVVAYGGDNGTGSETFTVASTSRLDDSLVLQRV